MSGSKSESEGGGGRLAVPEDGVELLGDPDEGRPAAQLLQLSGSDVGAGGAHASQDVSYRLIHRPFVGNFHRLPLRRSAGAKNTKHDSVVAKKKRSDSKTIKLLFFLKQNLTCNQLRLLSASSSPCRSSSHKTACISCRFSRWSHRRSRSDQPASRPASQSRLRRLKRTAEVKLLISNRWGSLCLETLDSF